MNRLFFLGLVSIVALSMACGQAGSNNSSGTNQTKMNSNTVDHNTMNHNTMNQNTNSNTVDHSKMDHSKMDHSEMKSSPDAASQPYDLQFIDTMIVHHQGAVDMAKMIEGKTTNPELLKFGKQIIADQEKEINQMKEWRKQWFADKAPAINMEMRGMADSMKMDMTKFSNSKDKEFDIAFVEMMVPHHVGAVEMSQEALEKSQKKEIKELATQIIKAQDAEIKMMKDWKAKWSK